MLRVCQIVRNKYGADSLERLTTSSPPTRGIIRITSHSAGFRAESLRILDNECMGGGGEVESEARSEADHLHNDVPRKHGISPFYFEQLACIWDGLGIGLGSRAGRSIPPRYRSLSTLLGHRLCFFNYAPIIADRPFQESRPCRERWIDRSLLYPAML